MLLVDVTRGGARHLHLGGPLEGPVLQQGELSMVCLGLSERDLKNFGGAIGGPGKIFGGSGPPWHPPSSVPGCDTFHSQQLFEGTIDKFTAKTKKHFL